MPWLIGTRRPPGIGRLLCVVLSQMQRSVTKWAADSQLRLRGDTQGLIDDLFGSCASPHIHLSCLPHRSPNETRG